MILWHNMPWVYVCAHLSVCAYHGALNLGPDRCLFSFQASTVTSVSELGRAALLSLALYSPGSNLLLS